MVKIGSIPLTRLLAVTRAGIGKDTAVGPWPGGVNYLVDPSAIGDQDLAECINFDIDDAGHLITRRGFQYYNKSGVFLPVNILAYSATTTFTNPTDGTPTGAGWGASNAKVSAEPLDGFGVNGSTGYWVKLPANTSLDPGEKAGATFALTSHIEEDKDYQLSFWITAWDSDLSKELYPFTITASYYDSTTTLIESESTQQVTSFATDGQPLRQTAPGFHSPVGTALIEFAIELDQATYGGPYPTKDIGFVIDNVMVRQTSDTEAGKFSSDFITKINYSTIESNLILNIDGNEQQPVFLVLNDVFDNQTYLSYTTSPTVADTHIAVNSSTFNNYKSVVEYNGFLYFIPTYNNGHHTTMLKLINSDLTADVDQIEIFPACGDQSFIWKDRVFAVDYVNSTIYWSKATDPTVWAVPDGGFVKVVPGDGDKITRVELVNNSLIIFKQKSIHIFTFTADPGIDGIIRPLSNTIGALAAVEKDNMVYFTNGQTVYRYYNNTVIDIGAKLNLTSTTYISPSSIPSLNIIDNTLLLTIAGTTAFACNLRNGAWTKYTFDQEYMVPGGKGVVCTDYVGQTQRYYMMFAAQDFSRFIATTLSDLSNKYTFDTDGSNNYYIKQSFTTKAVTFTDVKLFKQLHRWYLRGVLDTDLPYNWVFGYIAYTPNNTTFTSSSTIKTPDSWMNTNACRFNKIQFTMSNDNPPDISGLTRGSFDYKNNLTISGINVSVSVGDFSSI